MNNWWLIFIQNTLGGSCRTMKKWWALWSQIIFHIYWKTIRIPVHEWVSEQKVYAINSHQQQHYISRTSSYPGVSKMGDVGVGAVTTFRYCTQLCTPTAVSKGTNRYFGSDFSASRIKFIDTVIQIFCSKYCTVVIYLEMTIVSQCHNQIWFGQHVYILTSSLTLISSHIKKQCKL